MRSGFTLTVLLFSTTFGRIVLIDGHFVENLHSIRVVRSVHRA